MFHPFHINLSKLEILDFQASINRVNPYNTLNTLSLRNIVNKSLTGKYINIKEVEAEFFPSIDAHIFISHSHADIEDAKNLANFLYSNFGLKSFIDAIFWKNVDDIINDLLCPRTNKSQAFLTPNRNLDNSVNTEDIKINCSHAYMTLAMSLLKTIDKTEAFFFLNSSNSTTFNPNTSQLATKSPWISLELLSTEILRRKSIQSHRKTTDSFNSISLEESNRQILHPINLSNLTEINVHTLNSWKNKRLLPSYGDIDECNLDKLYLIKNIS